MFRLTTIKMANWSLASKMAKTAGKGAVAGGGAQIGTKDKKGGKKDKPNPCQPSKKKEEKKKEAKPAVVIEPDTTPVGEKKDVLSKPMLDAYHPKQVEAAWYAWWEKRGFFHPDA